MESTVTWLTQAPFSISCCSSKASPRWAASCTGVRSTQKPGKETGLVLRSHHFYSGEMNTSTSPGTLDETQTDTAHDHVIGLWWHTRALFTSLTYLPHYLINPTPQPLSQLLLTLLHHTESLCIYSSMLEMPTFDTHPNHPSCNLPFRYRHTLHNSVEACPFLGNTFPTIPTHIYTHLHCPSSCLEVP